MEIVLGISVAVCLVLCFIIDRKITKLEDDIIRDIKKNNFFTLAKQINEIEKIVKRNEEILRKSKP